MALKDSVAMANLFMPQYDGTELGANRPLTNKLFESDMVHDVISTFRRAYGIEYGSGGDKTWRNLIRTALKHWERETCLRWEENGRGNDHVVFFRGSGCYSSVGRTGGSQMISIGYGCEDKGIVMHEVGHSLGFWHEQSRPDRDQYITLNKQFIIRGTDGNFERRTTEEIDYMGVPYDLGSVMHYGPNAFTNDWDEITIRTNDANYQRTIGQRAQPSFIDNGGYANPNNCMKCKCPRGLAGRTCEGIPQVGCGGELIATPLWQELSHRGKKKCYWRIRATNARIRFILSGVSYRCETTCKAYVEIKHNSDFQQTGFRTCCNGPEIQVLSEQAEMLIISDSTELNYETGFTLQYIQDSGQPLPKPPPPTWIPGSENRNFRGAGSNSGPIEKFILNAIPKVR
uniref:Metalloendopeptidase n=1 Tax=Angiostrongylus cantonensis TaxID=6313 RepID=A0A0K0CWQ5_ANGCA